MVVRRALPILAVLCGVAALAGLVVGLGAERILAGPSFMALPFGVVGVLLGVRRPHHPISWLLIAISAVPALTAGFGLVVPGFDSGPELQNGLLVAGLALVLVLFPTGSLPARWWTVPLVVVLVSWVGVKEFGVITLKVGFEVSLGVVAAAGSLVVCAAAPIIRFRRASGVERSQLRWLGAAAGLNGVALLITAIGFGLDVEFLAALGAFILVPGVALGLPGAILVAILRYRLYEIERIVSRTVTYALVAVLVTAIYAVPVLMAPEILGSSNDVVTAVATLAAAMAFNPLRRRVRRLVDRRFNRSAYDAALEVDRLAVALRDSVDLGAVSQRLAATATRTLQPGSVAVWLRP